MLHANEPETFKKLKDISQLMIDFHRAAHPENGQKPSTFISMKLSKSKIAMIKLRSLQNISPPLPDDQENDLFEKIQKLEGFLYNISEHEKRKFIPGLLCSADRLKAHTLLEPYKEMFPAHYRIFASPIQRGTKFDKLIPS
jgi:hypothetical protein